MQEISTRLQKILIKAWNLGLFPSILMRILKENGFSHYFSLSLSLFSPLAVTPSKVVLFSPSVSSGHSSVSAPCFCAVVRTLTAMRKHGLCLVVVQIVHATARISFAAAGNFLAVVPQLDPGFFLRHLSSSFLHFRQVFILHENKHKEHKNTKKFLEN